MADWEQWTGMAFPDSGAYVVPGALGLVQIDLDADPGVYEENVSLAPLDAEQALRALLAVKPDDKPAAADDGEPGAGTPCDPAASD